LTFRFPDAAHLDQPLSTAGRLREFQFSLSKSTGRKNGTEPHTRAKKKRNEKSLLPALSEAKYVSVSELLAEAGATRRAARVSAASTGVLARAERQASARVL
jgi:hypothetical protein